MFGMKIKGFKQFDSGLTGLTKGLEKLGKDLVKESARSFKTALIINIVGGTYSSGYRKYVARYEKWKRLYGEKRGYHQLMGDLVNAIGPYNSTADELSNLGIKTNIYMSCGIAPWIMDPGDKSWFGKGDYGRPKPIVMYAKVMEFGLNNHPKRAVFVPTADDFAGRDFINISELYKKKVQTLWQSQAK